MQGSELRFITRQRSAIFHDVVYYVQNEMLFEMGFLAKLRYFRIAETDYYDTSKLRKNSNGSDYTDASVRDYHREINFPQKISQMAQRLLNGKEPRKSVLIFVRFLEEAREVVRLNPSFGYVDGKTPQNERDLVLKNFKSGKIKVMINSGVLTTGFDYPELDCVLIARDTMSLALYYQIVGRGIRIHTSKKDTFIVDMCQNINRFGKVEDLKIKLDLKKRYYICGIPNKKEKQLTNCIIA
jgi:DNA repair protein RadD